MNFLNKKDDDEDDCTADNVVEKDSNIESGVGTGSIGGVCDSVADVRKNGDSSGFVVDIVIEEKNNDAGIDNSGGAQDGADAVDSSVVYGTVCLHSGIDTPVIL
ncbi:conserved hypothetical protein [Ricinus communis]|uniref:Uncharacterized protein n=1 Tax=Ricinus communis TaxID=3988 RepID=B9SP98_RICCO|nr:conserved hypothetical protein [Ricinus communis]